MRNLDLETVYNRIDKTISLSSAYSKNIYMKDIIKSCRLKPYSIFNNDLSKKAKLETHWIDEFNNSLYIDKYKVDIVMNDSSLDDNKSMTTDLFYGLDIYNTINISSFACTANTNEIKIIYLVGNDRYLRCFKILNQKEIIKVSPLYFGIEILSEIIKNNGIKFEKELIIKTDDLIKMIVECNFVSIKNEISKKQFVDRIKDNK
jgi:hypothetical protein